MTGGKVVDITIVSKLSMRTIKTQPAKFATAEGRPIAVVYGQATAIKEVVDKVRGDVYHALVGQFEAQNLQSGEVFRSGQLYLPTGIHEMLEDAVKKLETDTDFVSFAIQLRAVTAKNPAGYSYEAQNLLKTTHVDPLDDMRAQLEGTEQPKLPAPAKTPKAKK
jgi:hypothetical protein